MNKRRISTLAIAGLTSLAVAVTPAVVPNTALLSAAVADAQETAAPTFTTGPAEIKNGAEGTFTVRVPNPEANSKVQFFFDNVPVGTVDVSGGNASIKIKPTSYGSHKVIARYVDPQGFNPRADVTRAFTTPLDVPQIQRSTNGRDDATGDDYTSKVNGKVGTYSAPVDVAPGANVTLFASMKINSTANTYVYEMGINPPAGASRVSAKRLDDTTNLSTTGNADGTATTTVKNNFTGTTKGTSWGRNGNPRVNPAFFGMDTNTRTGYWTRDIQVEGVFTAPKTPGIYISQHSYYKFWTNDTHFLRRMDDAVFRVTEPKLPPRKQKTNSQVKLDANQKFTVGEAKDLTVTVIPSNAAGTVTIKQGETVIASGVQVQNGKAIAKNVVFNEAGDLNLSLEFVPSSTGINGSTGTGSVNVTAPATQTTLSLDLPETAVADDLVDLVAEVSPAASGQVEFFDGEESLGTSDVETETGKAVLPWSFEEARDHEIKAVFKPANPSLYTASETTGTVKVLSEPPAPPTTTTSAAPSTSATPATSTTSAAPSESSAPTSTSASSSSSAPTTTSESSTTSKPSAPTTSTTSTTTVESKPSTSNSPTSANPVTSTTSAESKPSTSATKPSTSTTTVTSTTSADPKPSAPSSSAKPEPKTDAETYTPKPKDNLPEVDGDKGVPQPIDFIDNAGDLPGGTVFEWKKQPDVTKGGEQDAVIEVTYPDGTKEEVKVKVAVAAKKTATPTSARPSTSQATPTSKQPTPSTTPSTSKPEPTTTKDKGSSLSSDKNGQNGGSSAPVWLQVVLGILFSIIGIGAGFFGWQQFGPK